MCCCITSRNFNVQICCIFGLCFNKGSYQTDGVNFITSQPNACLAWDFTDFSMSLWRIFLTQNQIVNWINIFFSTASWSAANSCKSVDCAVSLNFLSSLLMLLFVHHLFGNRNLFINSIALYSFIWYHFSSKSYLRRCKPCLQTLPRRI